jgi:hypothetical protein
MPWFKVDDKLHDHRKTRRALRRTGKRRDAAAVGLWSLAGSWSADNLTDGFVPADELGRWDDDAQELAERLVDAEFWYPDVVDGEEGFRFVNWGEHQPTKDDVERKREQARERMRTVRENTKKRSPRVRANKTRNSGAVTPTPTRPDPSPAAAAADTNAAAAAVLPTPIAILRDKLQAHSALQALRFDGLALDREVQLEALIERHGDQKLVDVALRTLRTPPPVHVSAFLGTWAALPDAGQRLAVVKDPPCTEPGHSGTTRHCTQCAADKLAGDAR